MSDGYLTPHDASISMEMLNGSPDTSLAHSPIDPGHEARESMARIRPKSLVEKARMNVGLVLIFIAY